MSCTCRVAPLRSFLSGLAQVHRLDAAAPRRLMPRLASTRPAGSFIVARSFHHGTRLQKAEDSTGGTPDNEDKGDKTADTPLPDDTPKNIQHTTEPATEEKRVKKPRWRDSPPAHIEKKTKASGDVKKAKPRPRDTPAKDDSATPGEDPLPAWRVQKEALKAKFPEGWRPRKRLSPDALAGIRALNAQFPDVYTTHALSARFEVPVESIRRILKSQWRPSAEEEEERRERWQRRGRHVWERKAALGVKPPRRWRDEGITRDPALHARRAEAARRQRTADEEEAEQYRTHRARINRPPTGGQGRGQ